MKRVAGSGRRSRMTDETVQDILRAIETGLRIVDAARIVGITDESIHKWRRENPDFRLQVETAKAKCKQRNIAAIQKAAVQGNWVAAAWWLERNYPEEFSLKDRQPALPAQTADRSDRNIFLVAKTMGPEVEAALYSVVSAVARRRHPEPLPG